MNTANTLRRNSCSQFSPLSIKDSIVGKIGILIASFLIYSGSLFGQALQCPENLDFELGDLRNWECLTGGPGQRNANPPAGCCIPPTAPNTSYIVTPSSAGPVLGRHDIMNTTMPNDPYGNFPVVAPGGGQYSLRLGDINTQYGAERVKYYISVPPGNNNYSFTYKFAAVLEDPNHTPAITQQPRMEVRAFNAVTGVQLTCPDITYVPGANTPGFSPSLINANVLFLPWTTASFSLAGQGGQTVIVDFATGDCNAGGHWGYGYLDVVSCGELVTITDTCDLDGVGIILQAPGGYNTYTWWNQKPHNHVPNMP